MSETIKRYFPHLSEQQTDQFERAEKLYREWNDKINVISRKDIDNLEIHHFLHSLAIAKFIDFKDGSKILDFGTGGGFPGIPLAILFPEVEFHLIDRIGKKIKVAQNVTDALGLKNVTTQQGDIGECRDQYDFVVSRAVMPQSDLLKLANKNISDHMRNSVANGLISLKGGDLINELRGLEKRSLVTEIGSIFCEPFFETKKIVYTSKK